MLATRIRQKDSIFYFASCPAKDILGKVRFISRYYGEGEQIAPQVISQTDEIAQFIARIEHNDAAFQRQLSRAKVRALKNFYEMAVGQPPLPGTVLLFTHETLGFQALSGEQSVGRLQEPQSKYLIIDGQHRLAALHFYLRERPGEGNNLQVPCIIFDGRSEDFAAEMFVIINSTPTRINKSHLVDLYERISWADPDRRFAARLVEKLYSEGDSPLRYRINRLGGRSQQDKWILQAELFNELHRWVSGEWRKIQRASHVSREAERYYAIVRDFLKAAQRVWGNGWGHPNYMVTKPVTLKAMIRVCADLARDDADPTDGRQQRWEARLAPWTEKVREFRVEGFYERFPAKGQIERVTRIHRDLDRLAHIEPRARAARD
ncbi:MAG: DGQHR domain-containing protein [Betaproteobacteria bacterium]|nr:DGQHR domain-containing protein [Betaproteobacteria bacterium]MDH3435513.1 DGQHR domain-containing protein [Betaproteobacteria bacterium]